MVKERYVKEGPNRREYGLVGYKNNRIDSSRRDLAYSQSKVTKRDKLNSEVSREGGQVYWGNKESSEEIVLPYTKAEQSKLREREDKVAERMSNLKEKYGLKGMDDVTSPVELEDLFKGKAKFELGYTANGQLYTKELKEGQNGKVYGIMEANGVLRNLERYADQIEKIEAHKEKHRPQRPAPVSLESTASVVASVAVSIAGLVLGLVFMSPSLTGNVVGSSGSTSTQIVGAFLSVFGIFGILLAMKDN